MADSRRPRGYVPAAVRFAVDLGLAAVLALLPLSSAVVWAADGGERAANLAPEVTNPDAEDVYGDKRSDWVRLGGSASDLTFDVRYNHLVVSNDSMGPRRAWQTIIDNEKLPGVGESLHYGADAMLEKGAGDGPAYAKLSFLGQQGNEIKPQGKLAPVLDKATGGWSRLEGMVKVPQGAERAVVLLGIDGARGKASFRNVWVGTEPMPVGMTGKLGLLVPLLKWLAVLGISAVVVYLSWGFVLGMVAGSGEKRQLREWQRLAKRLVPQAKHLAGLSARVDGAERNLNAWQGEADTWDWVLTPGVREDLKEMYLAGRAFRALHWAIAALSGADPGDQGGVASRLKEVVAEGVQAAANGEPLARLRDDAQRRVKGERQGVDEARALLQRQGERAQKTVNELGAFEEQGEFGTRAEALERKVANARAAAEALAAPQVAAAADAPSREAPACLRPGEMPYRGEPETLAEAIRKRAGRFAASAPEGEAEAAYRERVVAEGDAGIRRPLAATVDALEAVAYRISIGDFHRRHGSFVELRRGLASEVLPLLEAAPEDEAACHYHRALSELLDQLNTRLARAKEDVLHPGQSLAGVEDLDVRTERLRARADRLKDGDPGYLREQAKPSVQEHLRPLVNMLIRDFLRPLREEASPVAGSAGVSDHQGLLAKVEEVTRDVLRHTIELTLIEPKEGDEILETEHEEVDVLTPGDGAKADTVASVVEPGYRWAGELIARARVRSYR